MNWIFPKITGDYWAFCYSFNLSNNLSGPLYSYRLLKLFQRVSLSSGHYNHFYEYTRFITWKKKNWVRAEHHEAITEKQPKRVTVWLACLYLWKRYYIFTYHTDFKWFDEFRLKSKLEFLYNMKGDKINWGRRSLSNFFLDSRCEELVSSF